MAMTQYNVYAIHYTTPTNSLTTSEFVVADTLDHAISKFATDNSTYTIISGAIQNQVYY